MGTIESETEGRLVQQMLTYEAGVTKCIERGIKVGFLVFDGAAEIKRRELADWYRNNFGLTDNDGRPEKMALKVQGRIQGFTERTIRGNG